jgi:hypothetical protein
MYSISRCGILLFSADEINRTQKKTETQFLPLHTFLHEKTRLIGFIIMVPGVPF